jgi:drug/metabolite transporter (DMT)-like permease
MSSFEQLFFRLVFSFVILFSWLVYKRKLRITGKKRAHFFAAIGLTYAFFALSGLSAIAFDIPIAVSVALVYTQPIFTVLISFATRKEGPTPSNTTIIILGVIGAFSLRLERGRPTDQPWHSFSCSRWLSIRSLLVVEEKGA